MLYKNDKQFEVPEKDREFLTEKFNLPVRIKYLPELIKPNKKNRLPDMPNSINIPLHITVRTKTGIEKWLYCENVVIDSQGITKYTPRNLRFYGTMTLGEYDIELLWFIYYKSPLCANNALDPKQRKRPRFEIEDIVLRAKEKAMIEADLARVGTLIYDLEAGLGESRLRQIAMFYHIPHVENQTLEQVQLGLKYEVMRDKRNGVRNFLEVSKGNVVIKTRVSVQKAIDKGLLVYDSKSKKWYWANPGEPSGAEEVMRVVAGKNRNEALHDYLMASEETRSRLDDELKAVEVMEE